MGSPISSQLIHQTKKNNPKNEYTHYNNEPHNEMINTKKSVCNPLSKKCHRKNQHLLKKQNINIAHKANNLLTLNWTKQNYKSINGYLTKDII